MCFIFTVPRYTVPIQEGQHVPQLPKPRRSAGAGLQGNTQGSEGTSSSPNKKLYILMMIEEDSLLFLACLFVYNFNLVNSYQFLQDGDYEYGH